VTFPAPEVGRQVGTQLKSFANGSAKAPLVIY